MQRQSTRRAARGTAGAQYAHIAKSAAILQACCDFHSGQRSRGYRILCYMQRRIRRAGLDNRTDLRKIMHAATYKHITTRYYHDL